MRILRQQLLDTAKSADKAAGDERLRRESAEKLAETLRHKVCERERAVTMAITKERASCVQQRTDRTCSSLQLDDSQRKYRERSKRVDRLKRELHESRTSLASQVRAGHNPG